MAKNPKAQQESGASIPGAVESNVIEQVRDGVVEGASAPIGVAPAQSTLLARVLAHCHLGEPDDVVEINAEQAQSLSDLVDTDPAAVEYAQSLKA